MLTLLIFLVMAVGAIILVATSRPGDKQKPTTPAPSPNVTPNVVTPGPSPTEKKIKQMKTYRVAPTIDGITGKNTGDLKGDNAYISGEFCARSKDKNTGKDTCGSSIVTEYVVSYPEDFEFGQYALCNPGGEVGGTGPYKCGRCDEQCIDRNNTGGGFLSPISNQGSGSRELVQTGSTLSDADTICEFQKNSCNSKSDCNKDIKRCTPNPGQEFDRFSGGNWYSWPAASQCNSLDDLKAGKGCKWYVHKNTKNIKAKELHDKGYKMMTNEEINNNKVCNNTSKCTDEEIKNFVQAHQKKNLEVLENVFNSQSIEPFKQKCVEDNSGEMVCDDCEWNGGVCEGTCVEPNEECSGRNAICICR